MARIDHPARGIDGARPGGAHRRAVAPRAHIIASLMMHGHRRAHLACRDGGHDARGQMRIEFSAIGASDTAHPRVHLVDRHAERAGDRRLRAPWVLVARPHDHLAVLRRDGVRGLLEGYMEAP